MDEYNVSRREISSAALEGKINLYSLRDSYMYLLSETKLIHLHFEGFTYDVGVVNNRFNSRFYRAEKDREILDKTNLIVHIDEFEQALCFIEDGIAPPLLTVAYKCWQECFSGDVPRFRMTVQARINNWFAGNYFAYKGQYKSKKTEQPKELTQLIAPTGHNRKHPKEAHYNLPAINAKGHPYHSEELERAIKIWRQIVRKKGRDYNENDLNKHISYLATKEEKPFRQRLKKVLTRW